ncbi:hypothetical protein KC316_g1835 [Hortaea werneckii]|nr:hypothetical protein KC324_g1761 [Hortaea werneckii]KAI7593279.1 hypothetical protein KC316_g1835 [Hortaea werneckii]
MEADTSSASIEPKHPLHAKRWQNDFINWVARDDITFEQAASPHLSRVITNGGPAIKHLLPTARTVSSWLLKTMRDRKPEVKASLLKAHSAINISFDAWSTPNDLSLLGIVAHWINEKKKLSSALLGLRQLDRHDGIEIAPLIQGVVDDYGIGHRVGAFTMDNADNNDTCLEALLTYNPIDKEGARMRCFGHIVNLVLKALLYGSNSGSLQKELQDAGSKQEFKIWNKQGAVGRLHNIVTYIARSEQRIAQFGTVWKELVTYALKLIKDTGFRWSSTFHMISRALKLQRSVQLFFSEYVAEYQTADDVEQPLTVHSQSHSQPMKKHDTFADDDDPDCIATFVDQSAVKRVPDSRSDRRARQEQELERFMDTELATTYKVIIKGKSVERSFVHEPLRWWRERGEKSFPILARMAYDLFSVPGMSSECERASSAGKRMITDERYNLKPEVIEADQLVKEQAQGRCC